MEPVRLIVGLGNPGSKYAQTRHNAGFWFVDELAGKCNASFRTDSKFSGEVTRIQLNGQDIWLLKPTTFMNKSGLAARQLAGFYKIELPQILVVHDELDLPAGAAKLKKGGGHGGHNGLRDLHAHIGKDYWRLRLGIGHPGHKDQVVGYVLDRPGKGDEAGILGAVDRAVDVMPLIAKGEYEKAMNQLHT